MDTYPLFRGNWSGPQQGSLAGGPGHRVGTGDGGADL